MYLRATWAETRPGMSIRARISVAAGGCARTRTCSGRVCGCGRAPRRLDGCAPYHTSGRRGRTGFSGCGDGRLGRGRRVISCCERLRTSGGSYMSRSRPLLYCLLCVRFNSALFVSVGGSYHACVDGIAEIKPNRRPTGPPPADMPTSGRSRRVSTLPVGSARSLARWFSPTYVNLQFDKSNPKETIKLS